MSPSTRSSASITRSGTKREDSPLSSHKPSSRKRALSKAEQEAKSKKGKKNDSGVFLIILSYLSFILCFLDGSDVQEQSEISVKNEKKYVFNSFEK